MPIRKFRVVIDSDFDNPKYFPSQNKAYDWIYGDERPDVKERIDVYEAVANPSIPWQPFETLRASDL